MQGAVVQASVRTHFGTNTRESHFVLSQRGARLVVGFWKAFSIKVLTPEVLAHAIETSSGQRVYIEIKGSFVGEETLTSAVDPREQVPPSYPLSRASVFIEVLPAALRFKLSCDGTYVKLNPANQAASDDPTQRPIQTDIEFELADEALSVAVQGPSAQTLVELILSAKTHALTRRTIVVQS